MDAMVSGKQISGDSSNIRLQGGEHTVIELLRTYLKLPESAREVRTSAIELALYGEGVGAGRISCFPINNPGAIPGRLDWQNGLTATEEKGAILMADSSETAKQVMAFLEMAKEKYNIPYERSGDRIFKINLGDFLRIDEATAPNL